MLSPSCFWSRGCRFSAGAALHLVKVAICGGEEGFDGFAVLRADGDPDACGQGWLFSIFDESIGDSLRHLQARIALGFGENESELVAAVAGGGIDATAIDPEHPRQAAQCPVAREMALSVVDRLQAIQV